jgi:hypothetical protein
MEIDVFCVDVCDVLVVTSDTYLTTLDDVVEELTSIVCCEEFLFADSVLQLSINEFLLECADDLLSTVEFLSKHCSHCILLRGVWVYDEFFIGVRVGAQIALAISALTLLKAWFVSSPQANGMSFLVR